MDQGMTGGVQFSHEGVAAAGLTTAVIGGLEWIHGGEVERASVPGHNSVPGGVHTDAPGRVGATAAEVGGVNQGARRAYLGHERVRAAEVTRRFHVTTGSALECIERRKVHGPS